MTELAPELDWSPDAIFTEAHALEIMDRGACQRALIYIGCTVGACVDAEPVAALRYAADRLTPKQLDDCAKAAPRAALRFAADRLTPERLDASAEAAPRWALTYAADIITAERRAWCEAQL